MRNLLAALLVCAFTAPVLHAQANFFQRWQRRASATQSKQPKWSCPLNMPFPMLIQVFRYDAERQIAPTGANVWNYGVSKGLNLVPGYNSEIDLHLPPYLEHNSAAKDGFDDLFLGYKYRFVTSNAQHGNYAVSAQLFATVPTGSYSNGSPDAVLTPTLEAGKGYGRFDVISTLGGSLPTGDTAKLGHSIAWNTVAQYKIGKYWWPELESNMTHFVGGKNDGKTQEFLEPGFTACKFKFQPRDASARGGLAFGAGMQIATSGFHSYNHALVLTARLLF